MAKNRKKKDSKNSQPLRSPYLFWERLFSLLGELYGGRIPGDYEYLLELFATPGELVRLSGEGNPVSAKSDKSFRADRVFEEFLSQLDSEQMLKLVPDTAAQSRDMLNFAAAVKMGKKEDEIWRRITGYANMNRELAGAICKRFPEVRALEIMGGNGLVSNLLSECGMRTMCTDIAPGRKNDYISMGTATFCDILPLDAVSAVKRFGKNCDLLVCSWPPQGETRVLQAFKEFAKLRKDAKMLYFGELRGGFNADDEFFDSAQIVDELDGINKLHIPHIGSKDVIRLLKLKS